LIDLTKAAEIVKEYTKDIRWGTTRDDFQASIPVPQESNFFVMFLKCDIDGLQMEKVEKVEANRNEHTQVTNWKDNPLVAAKFDEIKEKVKRLDREPY